MWIISIIIFQPHGYWRVTMWVWVAMWTLPHVDLITVSNGTGGSYSFYKWKSLIETYLYNLVLSQFQWGKYFHLYMFLSQIECIHIWSKSRRCLMVKLLHGLRNVYPSKTDYILKTSLTRFKSEMDGWTTSLYIVKLVLDNFQPKTHERQQTNSHFPSSALVGQPNTL